MGEFLTPPLSADVIYGSPLFFSILLSRSLLPYPLAAAGPLFAIESPESIPNPDGAAERLNKGASIYDVRKIFGILDPLPPCPHLGLIYSTKFTKPPLLHLLLG